MTMQKTTLAWILLALHLPVVSFSQLVPSPHIDPAGPPLFVVTVKGKDGFIDASGKIVIEPTFDKAYPFTDGLAAVRKQGRWGFIDPTGRMVIEPRFIMVGLFSDGLARFRGKRYTEPWGYIDKSGTVIIEQQFEYAEDFRNGIARTGTSTLKGWLLGIADAGGELRYKFIDRTGSFVPEPSPQHYATGEPGELIPFWKNNQAGYINAMGEVVIAPQFLVALPFSDGLACACKDKLFGFINKQGEWVIPPRFEHASQFSEGLAGVPLGDEGWGFIDHTGDVVIPARFGWVYEPFRHGIAAVTFDAKLGYINKKGEWIWPPSA